MSEVKPERALYLRLKENLRDCLITRIESRVNLGIPDCLIAFSGVGRFVMVELKVVKRGRQVLLSPHQVAFHLKHASLGCPTFILVQYHPPGTTSSLKADLRLYRGDQVEALLVRGMDEPPVESWTLAKVDWQMLRGLMAGG